jgi:hypothetical protein
MYTFIAVVTLLLRAGWPTVLSLSPDKSKAFLQIVHNGSGAHPVSSTIGTGGGGSFSRQR